MTAIRPSGRGGTPALVVGIGDDGPDGLAPGLLARVRQAEVLVGGRRHLDLFAEIDARRVVLTGDLESAYGSIENALLDGRRVVVLASGDPCYFGIGPLLAARLGHDRIEIAPNVSSVALAFARLGLGWQDARVVSAHGRPVSEAIAAARGASKLAVLTDDLNAPGLVGRSLLAAGADDADAWVFEHLGGPREAAHAATLSTLGRRDYAALNVLVVPTLSWKAAPAPTVPSAARPAAMGAPTSPTNAAGRPPFFGQPESEFLHTAGLITKPEVRAVSLSKLRLRPGAVLWDVGAGSGSLSIEAATLIPDLRVYAVEQAAEQRSLLWRNVGRLAGRASIQVVDGTAPAALDDLPDPDAVFVGGSGGSLPAILEAAVRRLGHDGRIVLNLVILDRVVETVAWARARSITAEVVQVGVARGTDIVGLTRLQAENPVTIVTLIGRGA